MPPQFGEASQSPLVRSLHGPKKHWYGVAGGRYYLINTLPKWREVYNQIKRKRLLAFDTETSGLKSQTSHIVGFSFSYGAEFSYYVPIRHTKLVLVDDSNKRKPIYEEKPSDEKQLDIEQIKPDLIKLFSDDRLTLIWHNFKFDGHFLIQEGIFPAGIMHDTRLMFNLLDENSSARLKDISTKLVHIDANQWEFAVDDFRAKFGRKHKVPKKEVHYGLIPLDIMVPYAASDAHYTWALYKKFITQIMADKDLKNLYINVEYPLMHILLDMEHQGVCVDREYFGEASPMMESKMKALEVIIRKKLGNDKINISSNKQMVPALMKKGVKFRKKTKTGFSLDREVLEKLATKYDLCTDLLEYRNLAKKKSTYADSILEKSKADGCLHCEYNQNVATGRLSSKQPSLMNLPGQDEVVRKGFVSPVLKVCNKCNWTNQVAKTFVICPKCGNEIDSIDLDYFMLLVDFSQIELRVTAHFCLQRNMIISLENGETDEIGTIVNNKLDKKVLSYDFDEKEIVSKEITNYWRNGNYVDESIYRDGTEDWLIIRHEGAPHRKLVLTSNHFVYDHKEVKKPISGFKKGDKINYLTPNLEGQALQLFLGTMLGDGNFKSSKSRTDNPNGILRENLKAANFYHCNNQKDYFDWKVERLKPFITSAKSDGYLWRAQMFASHHISRWHKKMVINGKKKYTTSVLKELNWFGLAIWYMDDGSIAHDKRCRDTKGWSCIINGQKITTRNINFINKKFGLKFRKQKKGMGICGPNAEVFFRNIRCYVPPVMQYKLPHHHKNKYEEAKTKFYVNPISPVKIIEKRKPKKGEPLFRKRLKQASFDLEVKDTHNYFASGVLVSNSEDPILLQVYQEGIEDVHTRTLCEMFDIDYDEAISILDNDKHPDYKEISRLRKVAKMINFLIIYGGGALALAANLSTPKRQYQEEECKQFIKKYLEKYKGVQRWINKTKIQLRKDCQIQNYFGRYRRLPELQHANRFLRGQEKWKVERALRQGVNYLIQSSAADLFKTSMIRVNKVLKDSQSRLVVPIHDEIIIYFHRNDIALLPKIKQEMEDFDFRVPIIADFSWSLTNWSEKKEIKLNQQLIK